MDYENQLAKLDELIKHGEFETVSKILNTIPVKSIPREQARGFSELAWRVSEPLLALKILHAVVHPENTFSKPAEAHEVMAYGSALVNLGAVDEALALFKTVDPEKDPEVLFRIALAQIKKWDYKAAIPHLIRYIENARIPEYKRLVGKVNLASAYMVEEKKSDAETLLNEIIPVCREQNHLLLLGNCLELRGQSLLFQSRFAETFAVLKEARSYLKEQGGNFLLFNEKWMRVAECLQKRDKEATQKLRAFKSAAINASNWETVRDCDLFEAIATDNEELARKLLFGTPFPSYRARLRHLSKLQFISRGRYVWTVGEKETFIGPAYFFDPYFNNNGAPLFKTAMLLSLFEALTDDFYKPSHLGLLFQKMYPDQKFDPFSSPARVLRLIKRLNAWFTNNQVPIEIHFKKSEFQLRAVEGCLVNIVIQRAVKLEKRKGHLQILRVAFRGRSFTVACVATELQVGTTTAKNIISEAIKSGQMKLISKDLAHRYEFIKKSQGRLGTAPAPALKTS